MQWGHLALRQKGFTNCWCECTTGGPPCQTAIQSVQPRVKYSSKKWLQIRLHCCRYVYTVTLYRQSKQRSSMLALKSKHKYTHSTQSRNHLTCGERIFGTAESGPVPNQTIAPQGKHHPPLLSCVPSASFSLLRTSSRSLSWAANCSRLVIP